MAVATKQRDIFISYRREDGALYAHILAQSLAEKGYSVFYDRRELVAGSVFPAELEQAVEGCHDFIAIVSPMYLGAKKDGALRIAQENDWVRKEISLALENGKGILPVNVGTHTESLDALLPETLKKFSDHNFIRFDPSAPVEEFISRLELGFTKETRENREYHTLLQKLREISDEQDNDFNIKVRKLIMEHSEETVEKKLLPLIRTLNEEDTCFTAYYAAFTFYRRLGYVYKIHGLVEEFHERFSTYRFNNIIMSQHYSALFELEGHSAEDLRSAITYARKALELIPNNSGVMQNYADLVTKSFELRVMNIRKDKEQLEFAIGRVEDALEINPNYPKYHSTRGRLLSFTHQYQEAITSIQKAISLENMETKDSFIRIVDYNKYIFDVKLRSLQRKVKKGFMLTALLMAVLAMLCVAGWFL